MRSDNVVHRCTKVYLGIDLDEALEDPEKHPLETEIVTRIGGSEIRTAALEALFLEFHRRAEAGEWSKDRAVSDRWLAPRVHACLRLSRAQASDRSLWHWIAITIAPRYTAWRWVDQTGKTTVVTDDRWYGPIHKQSVARLWWGAELFRDGSDYEPVERAFIRQDLINSYMPRVLVRCRSFALGIVNALATKGGEAMTAAQMNDLARVLNLVTAGRPPEAQVGFQSDDLWGAATWASSDAPVPSDWDIRPEGPRAIDTTETSLAGGLALAEHGLMTAGIGSIAPALPA